MRKLVFWIVAHSCLGIFIPYDLYAGFGNLATEHGLAPLDMATSSSSSMFSSDAGAAFYNPASLASGDRATFSPGLTMVASHLERSMESDRATDQTSAYSSIGMKVDLGSGLGLRHRLNLGLNLAVAGFGREMLNFEDAVVEEGQELRYRKKPMFFNFGLGVGLSDHLSLGFGTLVTVDGEGATDLHLETDGQTSEEKFNVTGRTRTFPIVGLRYSTSRWGVALSYRSESYYHLRLNAANSLRVEANGPIDIKAKALDTYTPETWAFSYMRHLGAFTGYVSLELQKFSQYSKTSSQLSSVQRISALELEDVVVPRVGGSYRLTEAWSLSAGVSYERSPIKNSQTKGLNYIDHDRTSLGLGAEYTIKIANKHPVKLRLSGQYQNLAEQQIELNYPTFTEPEGQDSGSLSSKGYATAFSISLTSQL